MVSTNCNEYTVSSFYIYTRAFISKENGVEVMKDRQLTIITVALTVVLLVQLIVALIFSWVV